MTLATTLDAITAEVLAAALSGIVQEQQQSLFRTGFSTVIRETQDASCALLDAAGRVVAQHVVLGLHMGAFPACIEGLFQEYPSAALRPGDAFVVNHPYRGGSPHAPDMAVITPVFRDGRLIAFAAAMAHKPDIGGPVPGSCLGSARETYNEGLHLPPVRYATADGVNADLERIIAANSRTPELVLGDLRGQLGACRLGERRLLELADKYGLDIILAAFERIPQLAEARVRAALAAWPDGAAEAERFLDDDGVEVGKPVRVHVRVTKQGDRIRFDFRGSDDQAKGPANVRPPLVRAACGFCLMTLVDPYLPVNDGLLRIIEAEFREGSVCNPRFPAPVNTYNPTMHAIADALFEALSHLVPDKKTADGCGTRSIIVGHRAAGGRAIVQYELFGGGSGGRLGQDGVSGTTVNHSNGKIAAVEIVESEYPVRVERFELIRDSGGAGQWRGGLGFVREYTNLGGEARFSVRSTKHTIPPRGMDGGADARGGCCTIAPGTPSERVLPTRQSDVPLATGTRFVLETPGGGGYGDPRARDPQAVLADVLDGYVSPEAAAAHYGVRLTPSDDGYTVATVTQARAAEA
ncbi:MAG TPA: hydantoinase B/oxoprolinase family protein [Chloroflexota bacterium]|nr:hydantoinase B/oxoprolinase family protein [Chloroflexota bacterium]